MKSLRPEGLDSPFYPKEQITLGIVIAKQPNQSYINVFQAVTSSALLMLYFCFYFIKCGCTYCQVTLQIPVVMSFAVPDRPREVRMEAAYFSQQLCQSRCWIYSLCGFLGMLYHVKVGIIYLIATSLQLLDIANVHCLWWNTCFSGLSGGWLCEVQVCSSLCYEWMNRLTRKGVDFCFSMILLSMETDMFKAPKLITVELDL